MIDQTQDLSGQKLYRLAQLYSAPEFVKNASVEELCGNDDMGSEVYADPVHRLFPCHTPAATWASTAFFLDKRAELKPADAQIVNERLQKYAEYHRIVYSINTLRKEADGLTKSAEIELSDDDYALVFTDNNGKHRHYAMRNALEVKAAADYLYVNRDAWPYQLRREFADKVMQKAAAYGAALGDKTDFIERVAGYGACSAKTAAEALRDRVTASRKGPGPLADYQQEMLKLADVFDANPSKLREPGVRVKLAEVMDDFDRSTGIYRHYGEEFQRPEDILFEFTNTKMASVAKDHIPNPHTGTIYKMADIERLKTDYVRTYLGEDLADAISGHKGYVDSEKAAAVIPTMDLSCATAFDQMMDEIGLRPIAKEASVDTMTFSHSYLQEMAKSFRPM